MKIENIIPENRIKNNQGIVKVTTTGNVLEIMEMTKVNRKGSSIVNLGNDEYILKSDIDILSGEINPDKIKTFNRTENRGQNKSGLAQSMKNVRNLINCNVTQPQNVRWMTFTYAENMTDNKRLYEDRKAFWKRVIRWHKKQGLSVPEYISIVEPQGRGAWHLHELWIYPDKAPFLPNETIRELWQQGFVTVKKLEDVDNVGAYVTAYLCDVPIEEYEADGQAREIKEVIVTDENGKSVSKKYVKGGRLHLYPAKMNFYRTSRGIQQPIVEWMAEEKAKEKASSAKLTYSKTIRLTDEEYSNDIHYEYYNKVRKD